MSKPYDILLPQIEALNGCKIVSFVYTAKGTGEVAQHTVLLGVNLERAYKRDIKLLSQLIKSMSDPTERLACGELIDSLDASLTVGIGNNPDYTNYDVYESIVPGLKIHKENKELHIYGFSLRKTVITPGVKKEVRSAPKTIAKNNLRKKMKSGRFRQYAIAELTSITINGTHLTFA